MKSGSPRRAYRLLRRGAKGADVAWLQAALGARGYDPGPRDGHFGYLTEDAVRALQRDYGLRADGVAGPQVYQILQAARPVPPRRIVYRACGDLTVAAAAQRLGAPLAHVVRVNGLRPRDTVRAGEVVACLPRWCLLALDPSSAGLLGRRIVERYGSRASGLLDMRPPAREEPPQPSKGDGRAPSAGVGGPSLGGPGSGGALSYDALLSAWGREVTGWVEMPFDWRQAARLPSGFQRSRRKIYDSAGLLASLAAEAAADPRVRGFHLSRGPLPWGQGVRWARAVVHLSEVLWKYDLTLIVTLTLPDLRPVWRRAFNDLSLHEWVPWVQAVIVPAPPPGTKDWFSGWLGRLRAVRAHLPPWKCVAGLDLRAAVWSKPGRLLARLSHQQALALAHRHRVRPQWNDERGCSLFEYREDGEERLVCLWDRRGLRRWLEGVELHGLGGVCMGPAGSEDERLWDEAMATLCILRHVSPREAHTFLAT